MGKVKTLILTILILWLAAFVFSYFFDFTDFQDKIVIIPIENAITAGALKSPLQQNSVTSSNILKMIEKAEEDSSVKGIILAINSPGGTVVGSKEIADKIKTVDKPVVAWIREIGTSGAYWVASASDAVVADELSLTGSIGVISSYLEFSGLLRDFNVTYESLTTGRYKELGSPFKELSEDERRLLQGKLDQIHDYFVDEVASNRNLEIGDVKRLATGEFFLGREAYNMGLVDHLGGKDLAVNVTKQLANVTDAKIVIYETQKSLFDVLSLLKEDFSLDSGIKIEAR